MAESCRKPRICSPPAGRLCSAFINCDEELWYDCTAWNMNLKSQIATSSGEHGSQFVTGARHGGRRKLPIAFTEHGAIMAANVLNSSKAIEMSVFIVRAFVKMREQLMATVTLAKRLVEVENLLLTHDSALRDLYQKIRSLLLPPEEPERKQIGFSVKESRAKYRAKKPKRRLINDCKTFNLSN